MLASDSGKDKRDAGPAQTLARFEAYLEDHPDARNELRERIRAVPSYRSWLEQFNPGLLAWLGDGCRA